MERLRSFTEYIEEQGMRPGTSYKRFFWDRADEKTAEHLTIEIDSPIAVIERVRTGDKKPLIYTIDKMNRDSIGEDFSLEKMGESLFAYLKEKTPVVLTDSQLIIRASGAEEEVASFLEVKPSFPVLSVEETYYDANYIPLLYCINIFRTDRHYFRVYGRSDPS